MPSKNLKFRHEPKQERSGQTIERVLDAAAHVLGDVGYEAATMTSIAAQAGTSIGTVYQYFPKKADVVFALRSRFGEAMEIRLEELKVVAHSFSIDQIAERFIGQTREFVDQFPAYFDVMYAPIAAGKRTPNERERLRTHLINIVQTACPSLNEEDLRIISNIIPSLCKAMSSLYAEAAGSQKGRIVEEYTEVMAAYLRSRCQVSTAKAVAGTSRFKRSGS